MTESTQRAPGGYVRRRVFTLRFEDPQFEGLVIKVTPPTIGERLEWAELIEQRSESVAETRERVMRRYELFCAHVIEWNLTHELSGDVEAVHPSTLLRYDAEFISAVLDAWQDATARVAPPLPSPSDDGSPSGVPLPPMETLSPSPES